MDSDALRRALGALRSGVPLRTFARCGAAFDRFDRSTVAASRAAAELGARALRSSPEPIVVVHGPPTEEGLRLRRAERRLDGGYALLGAGAGLAGGAAFLGARFGRPGYCHVDGGPTYVRTARIAAGVVGGVGVALAFTGTGLVLAVPRADRRAIGTRRSSRLLQAGVTVAGLVGGFALGFATVFLSSLGGPGGLIACSNS